MKEFKLDNKKRIIEGIDAEESQVQNRLPNKKSEINNLRILKDGLILKSCACLMIAKKSKNKEILKK